VAERRRRHPLLPLARGVSQDDLARTIGITDAEIDLVDRGRRSLNVAALCLVAHAIGTSPLTLLDYRLTSVFTEDIALRDTRPWR
jgi:transcriptional regulator with XRE-family HTH domain